MTYEDYGEYRIFWERPNGGWQAMIRPPNSKKLIPGPFNPDPTSHKAVLAEAKSWIDRRIV
jgi:hypothetical protein